MKWTVDQIRLGNSSAHWNIKKKFPKGKCFGISTKKQIFPSLWREGEKLFFVLPRQLAMVIKLRMLYVGMRRAARRGGRQGLSLIHI